MLKPANYSNLKNYAFGANYSNLENYAFNTNYLNLENVDSQLTKFHPCFASTKSSDASRDQKELAMEVTSKKLCRCVWLVMLIRRTRQEIKRARNGSNKQETL